MRRHHIGASILIVSQLLSYLLGTMDFLPRDISRDLQLLSQVTWAEGEALYLRERLLYKKGEGDPS